MKRATVTIQLGLVPGVQPHPHDDKITPILAKARRRLSGSGPTVIGFRNEAGTIYRYEEVNGLQQELYLSNCLDELGFEDESLADKKMPKGVWNVFGPAQE